MKLNASTEMKMLTELSQASFITTFWAGPLHQPMDKACNLAFLDQNQSL